MPTQNTNIGHILLAVDPIDALYKDLADAFDYARTHKIILNQADIASQKTFCNKVYCILSTRLVQGLYAVEKTKHKLKDGMTSDNAAILLGTSSYALGALCEINERFSHPIPLPQLPSCKHLLSIEGDLFEGSIKELCDNVIVKQLINIGAIAKGIYDGTTIVQVLMFYRNIVKELAWEINNANWKLCEVEQWLLDKSKAECGYCFLALVKVGYSISRDIIDFINEEKAQNYIKEFEEKANALPQQYTFQPIYKEGNDLA